jgi:hypothetical protein
MEAPKKPQITNSSEKEISDDIFSKMLNEPIKAVLAEKEEEMIRDGIFDRTDPKLWDEIMPYSSLDSLPRAFIEDQTGIWVSLHEIQGFHSCGQVFSSPDPFPNCLTFDGERFEIDKGLYFLYAPPLTTIPMSLKEAKLNSENPEKLREKIKETLQTDTGDELLIIFDHYDETIKIYGDYAKAETLRFPTAFRIEEPGAYLFISKVPRLGEKIPYELTRKLEIYNYNITFDKEVTRFKIHSKLGRAELIFNQNDEKVLTIIDFRQCEDYPLYLEPHKLYLFSERRPDWARLEAEQEHKWFVSLHMRKKEG